MLYLNKETYAVGSETSFTWHERTKVVDARKGGLAIVVGSPYGHRFEIFPINDKSAFITMIQAIAAVVGCETRVTRDDESVTTITLVDQIAPRPQRHGKR